MMANSNANLPAAKSITGLDLLFYLGTISIWGTTWFAIRFQLGKVPPPLSIGYRFLLAAGILFIYALIRGRKLPFDLKSQLHFLGMGCLLFSGNYLLQYMAISKVASGLIAVAFATIVFWNALFQWLLFKARLTVRVFIGALIGLVGIGLVYLPDLQKTGISETVFEGLVLGLVAAAISSLGNMVSMSAQRNHIPVIQTNAFGMAYGALLMLTYGAITNGGLSFDWSAPYLLSLLYLAVFGSVLAFGMYLTLLGRIGPVRAAYCTILFPIIALSLSSLAEGFALSTLSTIGVGLTLLGNVVVLNRKK